MNKKYISPAIETYNVMKQTILDASLVKGSDPLGANDPILSKGSVLDILDDAGIELGTDFDAE